MSKCRSCNAEIVWIQTPKGKWIPCDAGLIAYKEGGNELLVKDDGSTVRCTTVFEEKADGMARMAHWATCPGADKFRRAE